MTHLPAKPLQGFTLIETLVAITVLMFAIVGPYVVIESVLQSSYQARDQLTASTLGQEAMEYVYQIRDSNYLNNLNNPNAQVTAFYGLDGTQPGGDNCFPGNGGHACAVDVPQQTVSECSNGVPTCKALPLYLSGNNLYTTTITANRTRFTRTVALTQIDLNNTAVVVTVRWTNHGTHSITISEVLTSWL